MLEIDIVNTINGYLANKGVRFSNELRMGIGIPDITLNLGVTHRLKPIDDYFHLSILSFIEEKHTTSFTEIKNQFLLTIERVKQYVSTLEDMSLVKVKNQIVRAIKSIFSSKLGITISIEAKLKDWKGACLQSQRYMLFSDYAYVAMPEHYIKNADPKLFLQTGIGLLSVSSNSVHEIIPAKKSNICDFIQKYLATSKIMGKYSTVEKKPLRNNLFTPYVLLQE